MAQFNGFHGKTDKGTPCYVINENETQFKVRLGSLSGYHGWSGGARRDVRYNGQVGWIAKEKVTRGKAK